MNLIYIMRHGQSTVNIERRITCRKLEGDLTPKGQEQAHKAGQWLQHKGITSIIHSPFHRAIQTAEIINNHLNLPTSLSDDLREMDCGSLEWRTDEAGWNEFYGIYERWQQRDWNATYPGGESYKQGFDRFNHCLMNLNSAETTLLVTHGGISVSVLPYLCVNAAALQGTLKLENTGVVILEPYGDGRYICRAWNQTAHLL